MMALWQAYTLARKILCSESYVQFLESMNLALFPDCYQVTYIGSKSLLLLTRGFRMLLHDSCITHTHFLVCLWATTAKSADNSVTFPSMYKN